MKTQKRFAAANLFCHVVSYSAIHCSSSSIGSGREKWYPCISSQPSFFSVRRWLSVSMPSHTVFKPRPRASSMIDWTMTLPVGSFSVAWMNWRSILISWIG